LTTRAMTNSSAVGFLHSDRPAIEAPSSIAAMTRWYRVVQHMVLARHD
jgi:hypothetical protein